MKILVFGLGSAGDVHPNVGLGLALQERGHRVVLVAASVFEPLARRLGLDFAGVGTEEEYNDAIQDPDLWHPWRSFNVVANRLMLPWMRRTYEMIANAWESGRIVVAAPATALGARIAQEKLGVALATVHLQPSMLRSLVQPSCYGFPDIIGALPHWLRDPYMRLVDRQIIDRRLAHSVNAFRAELGLPPVRRLFNEWIHSRELVIGMFPQWFAPPPPDWPPNVYLTGFPLYDEREARQIQPELEDFLRMGEPPIVFTAGSAMAQGKEFFSVSAEVCRIRGWRGILLTQYPEQLGALPDSVRHFNYVPFSTVLPRAAAFVHHGGIGTTAQALAAGVPQLVVPFAHDQPDNAVRVRRLGTGDYVRPKDYQANRVVRKLEALMGSTNIRENCRLRAEALARSTALESACELIERLD